ncbi:hypothetical protein M0802_004923 [Mischocyttarus mexicanus]|nr:hypothetical protein M0802_004923 [Mischocyttarus mexicanus]
MLSTILQPTPPPPPPPHLHKKQQPRIDITDDTLRIQRCLCIIDPDDNTQGWNERMKKIRYEEVAAKALKTSVAMPIRG